MREIRGLKGLGSHIKSTYTLADPIGPLLGPITSIYMQFLYPGSGTTKPAKPKKYSHRNQFIVSGTRYSEPFYFIMLKAGISSREEKFARFVMSHTDSALIDIGIKLLTH